MLNAVGMQKVFLAVVLVAVMAAPVRAANLALAVSMNLAGGGPDKFSTNKLINALFGHQKVGELSVLRKKFGLKNTATFFRVSDFAVPDAMNLVQKNNMDLPDDPVPPPGKTKALAAALYRASLDSSGKAHGDTLIINLVSRPVRDQLVGDIDKKFNEGDRKEYFAVLTQVTSDLHFATAGAK
jgi:hypothetical protein